VGSIQGRRRREEGSTYLLLLLLLLLELFLHGGNGAAIHGAPRGGLGHRRRRATDIGVWVERRWHVPLNPCRGRWLAVISASCQVEVV
jgi:hypothetical protein